MPHTLKKVDSKFPTVKEVLLTKNPRSFMQICENNNIDYETKTGFIKKINEKYFITYFRS